MRKRLLGVALAPLTAGSLFLAAVPVAANAATPAPAAATQSTGSLVQNVSGTVNGVVQTGTLTISRFVQQAGQLFAVGNLTLGGVNLGQVQVPVNLAQSTGSCQILHLDLGPLDLNLLGLQVHLNEVVLDITAQQGPGNLLGNLLCAVANLLNGPGSLTGLTNLLNQLLAHL